MFNHGFISEVRKMAGGGWVGQGREMRGKWGKL